MELSDEPKKTCFIISPIGPAGSVIRADADDFLDFIVRECSATSAYKIVRSDTIHEPGRITSQIMRLVASADLVICDVTGANANVYYEMALRHGLGLPIIVCAVEGTVLPFDTRDSRTIFYSLHARKAAEARAQLAAQIAAIEANGFKAENPIRDAQQVIALQSTEQASSEPWSVLLEKMENISDRLNSIEQERRLTLTPNGAPSNGPQSAAVWTATSTYKPKNSLMSLRDDTEFLKSVAQAYVERAQEQARKTEATEKRNAVSSKQTGRQEKPEE
jgi:hypothetical protein